MKQSRSKPVSASIPLRLGEKQEKLRANLRAMGRVLVAFSGGVDSSYLLWEARRVLGEGVLAVTASSELYPDHEIRQAENLARRWKVRHTTILTLEMDNPDFTANPPERCYLCKKELFSKLQEIADREGFSSVLDGANADDDLDFRPGSRAAAELGVRSPLREAGLRKADIRQLSRRLGIPTWDKPSLACLASRFPYHSRIDPRSLSSVAAAEQALRKMGLTQFRVRHHGTTARIEVLPGEIRGLVEEKTRKKLVRALKKAGYTYITIDLEGYRTGSMNETLPPGVRARRTGK